MTQYKRFFVYTAGESARGWHIALVEKHRFESQRRGSYKILTEDRLTALLLPRESLLLEYEPSSVEKFHRGRFGCRAGQTGTERTESEDGVSGHSKIPINGHGGSPLSDKFVPGFGQ